jgi:hypothetical protein
MWDLGPDWAAVIHPHEKIGFFTVKAGFFEARERVEAEGAA